MNLFYAASLKKALGAAMLCACLARGSLADVRMTNAPAELSLDECITLALGAAEKDARFGADPQAAQADSDLAQAESLPHLNVTAGGRLFFENGEVKPDAQLDFGARFLEVPQNIVRRRIALAGVKLAKHRQTRAVYQLQTQVAGAYLNCLRAHRARQTAAKAMEVAQKLDARWQTIAVQDAAIRKEKLAAANAARQTRMALENAETACQDAQRILLALCGLPPESEASCRALPDYAMPPVPLDRCQAWALAHRSDLVAGKQEYELSEQTVRLARMARLPEPRISMGYQEFSDYDQSANNGVYAAFSLRLPLWDAGEISARVRKAEAYRQALKVRAARTELDVRKSVTAAYLALGKAISDYEAARNDCGPEDSFRELDVRHKHGEVTDLELERGRLKQAERAADVLEKQLACYEQDAELLQAMEATRKAWQGGLIEEPAPDTSAAPAQPAAGAAKE